MCSSAIEKLNITQFNQINKEYQIYFIFVTLLIGLQLICNTIEPIICSLGSYSIPASAMFYVLSFALCDTITENFGFKLAVRATILNVIAQLVFCGIAAIVFIIPKQYQASEARESFQYIFGFLSREMFSSIISLLISMITNDYLINKLKLVFLGRGFWWRTIVATVTGEIVMLNIDYNITFMGHKTLLEIQSLIFAAMQYKLLAAFVLAMPTVVLSNFVGKNVFYLKPSMDQKTPLMRELRNVFIFRKI